MRREACERGEEMSERMNKRMEEACKLKEEMRENLEEANKKRK